VATPVDGRAQPGVYFDFGEGPGIDIVTAMVTTMMVVSDMSAEEDTDWGGSRNGNSCRRGYTVPKTVCAGRIAAIDRERAPLRGSSRFRCSPFSPCMARGRCSVGDLQAPQKWPIGDGSLSNLEGSAAADPYVKIDTVAVFGASHPDAGTRYSAI
jgi:hypothetical protein